MKNQKIKVVNVRTGKILELSEVAIENLKKMKKFSDYDILPDPFKGVPVQEIPAAPVAAAPVQEEIPVQETIEIQDPFESMDQESDQELPVEPKKRKRKSSDK